MFSEPKAQNRHRLKSALLLPWRYQACRPYFAFTKWCPDFPPALAVALGLSHRHSGIKPLLHESQRSSSSPATPIIPRETGPAVTSPPHFFDVARGRRIGEEGINAAAPCRLATQKKENPQFIRTWDEAILELQKGDHYILLLANARTQKGSMS